MRRAYYAAVSHTDAQIGRVLAALAETGLRNNTVVCIFADHGWSLGEHGEWAKHTNFELDVHAPWILSLPHPALPRPEATSRPNNMVSLYTEHVDIMPTLLEAAAGVVLPPCKANSSANLCTMGRSRVGLLDGTPSALSRAEIEMLMASEDNAAFSQYERPYAGANGSSPVLNTSWCALGSGEGGDAACTVGYSMVGLYSGSDEELHGEYRYTEWVGFNTAQAPRRRDWNDNAGTELYRHQNSTMELVNLAEDQKYAVVRLDFSRRLRKGPPTSGWGLPPS